SKVRSVAHRVRLSPYEARCARTSCGSAQAVRGGQGVEDAGREKRLAGGEELALLEPDVLGEETSEVCEVLAIERGADPLVVRPRPVRKLARARRREGGQE